MSAGVPDALDLDLIRREFPQIADGSLYFNTGSCGRKPVSVLAAMAQAWEKFNTNPTHHTFFSEEWIGGARQAVGRLLQVPSGDILLTQNSTQGIQLVMSSFLQRSGDEFVTTTHQHGSVNSIARYLEETRSIVIRRHDCDPLLGSDYFCESVEKLISPKTKLVQVCEIDCYSGWRPQIDRLVQFCRQRNLPLLVDGAHAPGQGPCRPGAYPMWVGSGHKWLGGPNGTGVLYAQPEWARKLTPTWVGDRFYNEFEHPLMRFEFQGTADVVRWSGLMTAIDLYLQMGEENVAARQKELNGYLRKHLTESLGAEIRTPVVPDELTGIQCATWKSSRFPDAAMHLKNHLWDEFKIWTQPDLCYGEAGHGLRLSCHVSIEEQEIDRLVNALAKSLAA